MKIKNIEVILTNDFEDKKGQTRETKEISSFRKNRYWDPSYGRPYWEVIRGFELRVPTKEN